MNYIVGFVTLHLAVHSSLCVELVTIYIIIISYHLGCSTRQLTAHIVFREINEDSISNLSRDLTEPMFSVLDIKFPKPTL